MCKTLKQEFKCNLVSCALGTAAAAPPPESSEPQPDAASSSTHEPPSKAEDSVEAAEAEAKPEEEENVAEMQPEERKEESAAAKYSEVTKPLAEMPGTAAAAPVPEAVKEEEGGLDQGYSILSLCPSLGILIARGLTNLYIHRT